jgi:uncharacterized membrane protein YgdD (TMEM256/DUF423 family)
MGSWKGLSAIELKVIEELFLLTFMASMVASVCSVCLRSWNSSWIHVATSSSVVVIGIVVFSGEGTITSDASVAFFQ